MLSFKTTFSLSPFTFIKRLFSSSLLLPGGVSSAYLRLLLSLHAILISVCASSSPAFHMMYSAYKFNKQGDNIQLWLRQTFVVKIMSLLFNTLSRSVIALLPRSKRLLISWLQSSFAVIWEHKKTKSVTVSIVSPLSCHEVMELDVISFMNVEF